MYAIVFYQGDADGQTDVFVKPTEQEARLAAIREYKTTYTGLDDEVTTLLANGQNVVYAYRDDILITITKVIE